MTTQLDNQPTSEEETATLSVPATPPGEVTAFTDARGDHNAPTVATPDVGSRDRIGWLVPTNPVWEGLQRFGGFLGLMATLPFMIIAFVLVKTTSRGPFLFSQLRRGYGGKPFLVYKIRSLKMNAEKSTALGVGRGESTVTLVGKVLRKLKIDEFPQFWNIFTGTMNIVGPRPIPIALEECPVWVGRLVMPATEGVDAPHRVRGELRGCRREPLSNQICEILDIWLPPGSGSLRVLRGPAPPPLWK